MSKSIAAPGNTSEQEITHPAWCGPGLCDTDGHDVMHHSSSATWDGPESLRAEAYLVRVDNLDGESPDLPTDVYALLDGEGSMSLAAFRDLGRWIENLSRTFAQVVANEGATR